MRHVRQGPNECLLASLAMVTGKTLDEVKADFERLAWKPYGMIMALPVLYAKLWREVRDVLEQSYGFGLPEKKVYGVNESAVYGAFDKPPSKGTRLSKAKLRGKGTLTFKAGAMRHAVAFEDGIIYDPSLASPTPYAAWKLVLRSTGRPVINWWRIVRLNKL